MIWLTGQDGMLGKEIAQSLLAAKIPFVGSGHEVDISNFNAAQEFSKKNPDLEWIINCAAYTKVDQAETEISNAFAANFTGPQNLARICQSTGARLIHFSTDYVFDGTAANPIPENALVNPVNTYGQSKLAGEIAIQNTTERFYIFRTSWLYGKYGRNFVATMKEKFKNCQQVKVVSDQTGCPTSCRQLSDIVIRFLKKEKPDYGIYNVCSRNSTTWFDFAKEIWRIAIENGTVPKECPPPIPCNTDQFPTAARRPSYSVLDTTKIQNTTRIQMPLWEDELKLFF